MRQLLDQVRILLAHVLRVPAEHRDAPVGQPVHLRALAVVLVLAREPLALEPVEHLADRLRGLRQHRLQRHARLELALFAQAVHAELEQRGHNAVVRRQLAGEDVSGEVL